jgi:hypothetical protein
MATGNCDSCGRLNRLGTRHTDGFFCCHECPQHQSPAPVDAKFKVGDRVEAYDDPGEVVYVGHDSAGNPCVDVKLENGNEGIGKGDSMRHWEADFPYIRHSPPPEVKPSERGPCSYCGSRNLELRGETVWCFNCAAPDEPRMWDAPPVEPSERGREEKTERRDVTEWVKRYALPDIGLACALIEVMRKHFAILHALRPGQTAGDLAAALGEPPPGKR